MTIDKRRSMDTAKTFLIQRIFLAVAALSGAFSVALGAYASHGLKLSLTPDALAVTETALNYQFTHTLALLFISLIISKSRLIIATGIFFILGVVFFSINLYVIQLYDFVALSKLTPVGGVCFILGWLSLFGFAVTGTHAKKNIDH